MRINTNLTAMNTYTQYTKNNNKIASSVEKLSSGYSINSASDNAAGLAISEKMRAQIRGLEQASSNSQDAISLVQTAEGSLSSATEILQRMREIAVQSSSDTNNDDIDRTALQDEFSQLQSELDDISSTTSFNKKNLLDGSLSSTSKSVSNVKLGNSSMAVSIGNATAGDYNYSVSVKQETAAVDGNAPTDYSAVLGTTAKNYFTSSGTVTAGGSVSESALLNGNYTLSTTSNDDGSMTITATGDNDQTFKATISATELDKLETDSATASTTLDIEFSAESDDAFTLSLGISGFSNDENGITTLSSAIADTTVTVSGGVTDQDATYGVYATLTGGGSVKLNTGDTSVTFSNGVTVSFNELTASDLDTANKAELTDTGASVTLPSGGIDVTSAFDAVTNQASVAITSITNDDGTLAAGDFTVSIAEGSTDGEAILSLKDANGVTYTSSASAMTSTAATGGATADTTFTCADADGNEITVTLTVTNDTADTAVDAMAAAGGGSVSGTASYALNSDMVDAGSATFSNFAATDNSTLAEGELTFSHSVDANGKVTLTATDANNNSYSVTASESDLFAQVGSTTADKTTTLTFADADGNEAFTIDLNTSADAVTSGAVSTVGSFDDTATTSSTGLTLETDNVGHNYSKVFGSGKTGELTDTAKSSFSVGETSNAGLTFQVGANSGDELSVNLSSVNSEYLGISSSKVSTQDSASAAITAVDDAINEVSSQRAYLGAIQNRLDYKISNLDTSSENLTAAESQIRDVDMAKEMTTFTNANILQQAATAMLAQANSLPQNVLSLIG